MTGVRRSATGRRSGRPSASRMHSGPSNFALELRLGTDPSGTIDDEPRQGCRVMEGGELRHSATNEMREDSRPSSEQAREVAKSSGDFDAATSHRRGAGRCWTTEKVVEAPVVIDVSRL